jgi:hypothetical protein
MGLRNHAVLDPERAQHARHLLPALEVVAEANRRIVEFGRLEDPHQGGGLGRVDGFDSGDRPPERDRPSEPHVGLEGGQQRLDGWVAFGDQVLDEGRLSGIGGGGPYPRPLVDLVQVANQGGDPRGGVGPRLGSFARRS